MMLSVILLSILMILLSTLSGIRYLICGNNQNCLLNLNLIYKTLWTVAASGFLISMLENWNLFRLTSLITLVLLMLKWIGMLLRKNNLLWCWSCLCGTYVISNVQFSSKKVGPWFFFLRLLCISLNLPYGLAGNTAVISGLVLLAAAWKYQISFKNGYVGLVLHLLPVLNPWISLKMQLAGLSLF